MAGCFDVSGGAGPLSCGVFPADDAAPAPVFNPLETTRQFIRFLTNRQYADAYKMMHPAMQAAWHWQSGQGLVFDPRSPFSCLAVAVKLDVTAVQQDPEGAHARMDAVVTDSRGGAHALSVYFERNADFDTFAWTYPALEWRIRNVLPQAAVYA